ncbi:AtpZ/AtpI family protein [uncultured Brachyspira sp.]|uniref:AtpZ/AtpI family protein n=1 Tax=uncultured Brachyspira sp. TaxID=221953 RepID=UPI0025DCE20A|nr:AtpZ/AtpI family protein [uncultured Brachyspira sp.]
MNINENKKLKNSIKYTSLGVEFGSMVLGLAFAGHYTDKHFNTKPLFAIIGIFAGFVFGIYRLYKISKTFDKINKTDKD